MWIRAGERKVAGMTNVEWLECDDWRLMLTFLSDRITERKEMLYVCAGLRSIWDVLYHDYSRQAVEVGERAADGTASAEEIDRAGYYAESPTFGCDFEGVIVRGWFATEKAYAPSLKRLIEMGVYSEEEMQTIDGRLGTEQDRIRLCNAAHIAYHVLAPVQGDGRMPGPHLLDHLSGQEGWPKGWLVREIFGNPFCPAVVDPAWLTWNSGTVARLAQAAYEERELPAGRLDAARLAVLADALEEASCADPSLLEHIRGPGPHVRGCWAVDALLGKA